MITDLQDHFDRAGHHPPSPAPTADDVLRRARQARSRHRARVGLGSALATGALMAVSVLVAGHVVGGSSTPADGADRSATATISYCIGEGTRYPQNTTVHVRFLRGTTPLGEVWIQVPMRVGIKVTPGPFRVLVDGTDWFDGSVSAGETAVGSLGTNCPTTPEQPPSKNT